MIYTSTTDTIAGHEIISHGRVIWAEEKFYYSDEAIGYAIDSLIEKAARYDYNAIIGIRHQVREEEDGVYFSVIGTMVKVD